MEHLTNKGSGRQKAALAALGVMAQEGISSLEQGLKWLFLPFLVAGVLVASALLSILFQVVTGIWGEYFMSVFCPVAGLLTAYANSPKYNFAVAILTFIVGIYLAYKFTFIWWHNYTLAQPVYPFIITVITGLATLVLIRSKALTSLSNIVAAKKTAATGRAKGARRL